MAVSHLLPYLKLTLSKLGLWLGPGPAWAPRAWARARLRPGPAWAWSRLGPEPSRAVGMGGDGATHRGRLRRGVRARPRGGGGASAPGAVDASLWQPYLHLPTPDARDRQAHAGGHCAARCSLQHPQRDRERGMGRSRRSLPDRVAHRSALHHRSRRLPGTP